MKSSASLTSIAHRKLFDGECKLFSELIFWAKKASFYMARSAVCWITTFLCFCLPGSSSRAGEGSLWAAWTLFGRLWRQSIASLSLSIACLSICCRLCSHTNGTLKFAYACVCLAWCGLQSGVCRKRVRTYARTAPYGSRSACLILRPEEVPGRRVGIERFEKRIVLASFQKTLPSLFFAPSMLLIKYLDRGLSVRVEQVLVKHEYTHFKLCVCVC